MWGGPRLVAGPAGRPGTHGPGPAVACRHPTGPLGARHRSIARCFSSPWRYAAGRPSRSGLAGEPHPDASRRGKPQQCLTASVQLPLPGVGTATREGHPLPSPRRVKPPSAWTPTSPGANSPILNQNPGTGLLPSGISIFPVKLAEILPPEMWRIGAHRKSAPGRPATPWGDSGLLWQPKPGGGKRHAWAWWGGNGALVNGRSRNPDRLHRKTPPPSSPPGAVESLGGTLMPGPGGHFAAFCRPPLGPRV